MSDRDVRKLAKIVADHSRQIKGLSGGPQAAYSSIEGGSMDAYDNDGKMRLRIGAQDDGTHAVKYVQGPPPPRPTAPVVSVDGPVVRVRWDGMLLGGHIPEDFARVDVHFALASDDIEDASAVRGNLATSAGNETVLAATQTGTYRVGLVAMSQSRARSEMSETVDVDVTLVDIEGALDAVVENARGGSNYYSPDPPSGTDHDPDRDLWFDTSVDAEGLVSYSPHRWDADLLEWVSVADQRTAALQDALGDFEGTVEQRFTDAGNRIDGLETSLTELDSTTLPGLRQDLDAAEGRLGEAEGQITDAFGQIESARRAGGNLIANGSFENGWTGWAVSAGERIAVPHARDGNYVVRLGNPSANQYPRTEPVETQPGSIYHVEYWVRRVPGGTDTGNLRAYVEQRRADGTNAGTYADFTVDGGSLPEAEWVKLSGTVEITEPAAVSARFAPHVSSQGTQYDIDSVRVVDVTDVTRARQAAEAAAVAYTDAQLSSEAADLAAAIAAAQATADEAMDAADGAIRTYYQAEEPTLITHPELKVGDMWYDTDDEMAYRWTGSQWNVIQDSNVAVALAKAEEALAVADGKITAYYQNDKPSEGHVGDLWFDLDDGNAPWYCASEGPAVWVPVRDEEIANAELRAAEDAKAKADQALQDAQEDATEKADAARDDAIADAEGKISVARQEAIDAAIEGMGGIPRPSYGASDPTHDAPDGSVYFQTDPAALVEYAWAGEPHASESIKYIDGEEVARNRIINGDFENDLTGWTIPANMESPTTTTSFTDRMWGGLGGRMFQGYGAVGQYPNIYQDIGAVTAGKWLGFSALLATEQRDTASLRVQLSWFGQTTRYDNTPFEDASFYAGSTPHVAYQAAEDADYVLFRIQMNRGLEVQRERLWADKIIAVVADTEEAALTHSEKYWDGNSPNEVINWQNKVTAQWERNAGAWEQVPIRSEAIANLDVGKLTSGTAEIAELVSRKIAAATGQFLELDVGQLTVTEQSKLADVVAEQIAADTAQFMELEVGKLVASEGILDEAVIKQLFAEVVVSQMSFADSFIGGNAILEGSVTAESGIIGSLDLGVAIVGKLHGQYVEAGSIDTEQLAFGAATGDVLSVDALNFKTAVGLDIRSSAFRAGDAVEITEDFGIRQFGPDGALNVSLPSDGSPAEFRGDLSARTLTATGRMSIQGPGAIASGGVLELESGVVPPVGPPSVSNYLQTTKFPPVADDESVWGLAWAGGSWWRGINKRAVVVGDRIERISPDGELESSFSTGVNPQGLTSIGDELFLLGTLHANSQGVDQVLVYSLTGTLKRRWEYPNYGTGTYRPGIGTDGTNILIAQPWQDGRLTWRRFNKTTGALLAQVDSDRAFSSNINAITQTVGDFGKQQVVITWGNTSGMNEVYETSGTYVPEAGWFANHQQQVKGTVFKDGHFYHITAGGDLVKMSDTRFPNGEPGVDTDDWWAAITWSDGTHETTLGPARQFMNRRRYDTRVSFGSPPEGATLARVYFARGVTAPSRTSFHRVGEVGATAQQSIIVQPIGWESLANPPASNTFPQSTPGLIRSGLGQFEVDGTGAGRWGPLTFHADGSMTSDQVPEWVPVTTFASGYGPQTWGFVPAYRIWPDGKVEWRGVVAGTINGTVTPFTIPAEARPAQPVNKAAAASGSGGTSLLTRIEFGSEGDPDKLRVYRGDSDRTWVSLDDTSYYLV